MKKESQDPTVVEKEKNTQVKKKHTLWHRCMWIIFLLFLFFGITSSFLLSTGVGQRGLIKLATYWINDLSIKQVTGNLQQGLQIQDLRYHSEDFNIQLATADLQIDFSCLLNQHLCIKRISLQQPQIDIHTVNTTETAANPEDQQKVIKLPSITLNQLEINQLSLNLNQRQLKLKHFETAVQTGDQEGIYIAPTIIQGLTFIQATSNKVTSSQATRLDSPLDWNKLKEQLTQPLLSPTSSVKLPFAITLEKIQGENWQYYPDPTASPFILDRLQLNLAATPEQIKNITLAAFSPIGNLTINGNAQFSSSFPFELAVTGHTTEELNQLLQRNQLALPDQQQIPASTIKLSATGNLIGQSKLHLATSGLADLTLDTVINLNQERTPFNLRLNIKQAHYPLQLQPKQDPKTDQLHLTNLDLNLTGNLLKYQLNLTGQVAGLYSPKLTLNINGEGTPTFFQITQANIKALRGSLQLDGKIDWEKTIHWRANLKPDQLHLEDYLNTKSWQSTLSGEVKVAGTIEHQNLQLTLDDIHLKGVFNHKPLLLTGNLNVTPPQVLLNTTGLDLYYGNNHLYFKGHLGKNSDFLAKINAPNLTGLIPHLTATLNGTLKLQGQLFNPILIADLQGNNLRFQQFSLQNFHLTSDINHQQNQIAGKLDLQANNFLYGNTLNLSQIKLQAQGNEQQHSLTLNLKGSPISLNLDLQGRFDQPQQRWQGKLLNANLTTPVGLFNNNQIIDLTYNNQQQLTTISAHCWKNQSLPLCFPQPLILGQEGKIEFISQNANLHFLQKFLPSDTSLLGNFNLAGNVAWFKQKPANLNLDFTSSTIHLKQKLNYRTINFKFDQINLHSKLADNNLSLQAILNLNQQGKLNSQIQIDDLEKQRNLNGTLQLSGLKLDFLQPLLFKNEKLKGELNSQLKFTGSLLNPLLYGTIDLNHLQASLQSLPFDIKKGQLNLTFNGNQSKINGKIISNKEDQLNLVGDAGWSKSSDWYSNLKINAQKFQLAILPFANLSVSPNIQIQATPKLLNLTGQVNIPTGNININQLPESAVKVSSDEVILNKNNQPPASKTNEMALRANIQVNIEKEVKINAYGLKSYISGILNVRQEQQNLGLFGQVNLIQGRYTSFGQDLLINKGQISFSGLPSQPFINIEAIRNPKSIEDNVIAGIKVTGSAESPQVSVFSDPAMSQDNALSYLLTGHSLAADDNGANNTVGTALIGLGLAQSSQLVGKLGETFGIQNLNLETQGGGDKSQVIVSGYITPRLQVKYGIGLFEPLAQLTLRYRLFPQLYIQSVSGTNQAVDLLYQFER
ncbi:hypothetical protein CEP48_01155 [Mergibacter septicus]|uniref:Translocation and assembly module TamB C-terminal domain-containing protein n=1 Tax=Mergibacter septicus TaxID=221402 RepID=A0A8E3MF49_9PAST|nr:translocation/assembly module TamB domain-containing protein [Mergibacter septicus]AWX14863.1 hypothetical protein CEP47_01155 [Mergibacter septicus]QDJ14115.1 hypothetical protein CEP48_01155 [Mergibacter septicus]UTU48435.1 translocation/assembly module TamB [Mergibacter septicus]WMR95936.1 translocation/assembly module TamB domain-containing protein [Mergibacter septicus]